MNWILMPAIDCWDYTKAAIEDCLAQTIEPATRVLVINNGSSDETRAALETWADREPRLLVWSHVPALPSLSASWNRALEFVWACGGEHALVVNNDVKLLPATFELLLQVRAESGALFVSAVGISERDWMDRMYKEHLASIDPTSRGGPDFSCFLISAECHRKYRFDEKHVPLYCEDVTYHRDMLLGGDGQRIFSVNVPYLHYGSRSINRSPEALRKFAQQAGNSRAYFKRAWGGDVNQERFAVKGDPSSERDGVSTPELQRLALGAARGGSGDVDRSATPDSPTSC